MNGLTIKRPPIKTERLLELNLLSFIIVILAGCTTGDDRIQRIVNRASIRAYTLERVHAFHRINVALIGERCQLTSGAMSSIEPTELG